ncbi:glycosyltransferase family 2 protein [Photobacterium satsumensis]|uniref:glycosyltransferase family 2 protein n=1 Tax=Photobacterium satsumensis TaxID=2910239 RepID=UPI003D0E4EFF
MKYSFISTSQGGRIPEFSSFLSSLENNSLDNELFEIIFVDQTNDEYDELLRNYSINIVHIKSDKLPLSKARNIALSKASGEFVFFSDDDADYSRFDFVTLEKKLNSNNIVSFPITIAPEGNRPYGGRKFPTVEKYVSAFELFSICLSLSVVIRRELVETVGCFDEMFGAGAKYGGSEETDLLLKLFINGDKPLYSPELNVMHPLEYADIDYDKQCHKFYNYAIGYSKICKRHSSKLNYIPYIELSRVMSRTLLAMIVKKEKRFYWYKLKGFMNGIFK